MIDYEINDTQSRIRNSISQAADMPYALYVQFTNCKYGWAGLVNPSNSCVNLYVYVWTVTNFGLYPLSAEIWFNTITPEDTVTSDYITPANTAICPLPRPKVKIL